MVIETLQDLGLQVEDAGPDGEDSVDYPDYAAAVARAVGSGRADRGVLICGTGIGMSIAANKIAGVRAALVHDVRDAEMSRLHNDANVLVLGRKALIASMYATSCVRGARPPSKAAGIERRIDKISELERREVTTAKRGRSEHSRKSEDPEISPRYARKAGARSSTSS